MACSTPVNCGVERELQTMLAISRMLLVSAACGGVAAAGSAQTLATASQTPAAPAQADDPSRLLAAQQRLLSDWPNLARYRDDNAKLEAPAGGQPRVVFMGDWITDAWGRRLGVSFFAPKPGSSRSSKICMATGGTWCSSERRPVPRSCRRGDPVHRT
jgi:hypothetical protein